MFEVEHNPRLEPTHLAEFLDRCGWEDPQAATKLGWLLAAPGEWVVCRLDGEMIGFGRSTGSSRFRQGVVSVLVDPRYQNAGLGAAMLRLLARSPVASLALSRPAIPSAPADAYLGRPSVPQLRLSQ
jgi:GNAT superfamily N-acetyltransferase